MKLLRMVTRVFGAWSRVLVLPATLVVGACHEDIVISEPPDLAAVVYGVATAAGQPVAGRLIELRGQRLTCDREVPIFGYARTDLAGRYRMILGGFYEDSRICVRVGLPSASGTDTLFVFDTLVVRLNPPLDSVRVDLNRAVP